MDVVDNLALLRREFEETRHRLLVVQQALAIAEEALEDIVVQNNQPPEGVNSPDAVRQHARNALRTIHTVLKQIDQGVEKGS